MGAGHNFVFMVDMDHLERARSVYEEKDGTTKASEDI